MAAVWADLLDTTQSLIQGLGLTWTPPGGSVVQALPSGQVYVREFESDVDITLPCLQVVLGGPEEDLKGDFEDTETFLPVKVVHLFDADQSTKLNRDRLLWRQRIYDYFSDLPRPEVTTAEVFDCQVSFTAPIDRSKFERNDLQMGAMLLKFRCLRSRNRS